MITRPRAIIGLVIGAAIGVGLTLYIERLTRYGYLPLIMLGAYIVVGVIVAVAHAAAAGQGRHGLVHLIGLGYGLLIGGSLAYIYAKYGWRPAAFSLGFAVSALAATFGLGLLYR